MRFKAGFTVEYVGVLVYVGRAVDAAATEGAAFDPIAFRLFVFDLYGVGDFVGESGVFTTTEEPRVVIHERSSGALGLKGRRAGCVFEGDSNDGDNSEGVDCFKGDPCGVAARTVEGDLADGDSGLRKGDARALLSLRPKVSGAGLRGLDGFDYACQYWAIDCAVSDVPCYCGWLGCGGAR